jgi:hypothetical protein
MANRDLVQGRSESLNKSISEIMKFLGDASRRPGGMGVDLRGFLHEKLADLAEYWYKHGVRRGHMESHKEFKATGALSGKLRYKGKREFFEGQERRVRVTSKIKTRRAQQGLGPKRDRSSESSQSS